MKKQHKNQFSKKVCKHCDSPFETKYKSKEYCTNKCKNDAKCARYYKSKKTTQIKKYTTKRAKLLTTGFGRWVLKECQRAGTVQVLQGHTVESLNALYELFKLRSKASGYVDGKPTGEFELSHIWSVKGNKHRMGLLHPQNLVLAPARLNRLHGSKTPSEEFEGIGHYLPTGALLSRYSVGIGDSLAKVEKQVFRLLGATWQQFVATLILQQGQQELLTKKLERRLGIKLPIDLSIEQLKAMAQNADISYFSANWNPLSVIPVLQMELDRHGQFKGAEYDVYSSWLKMYEEEFCFLSGASLGGLSGIEQGQLEQLLVGEVFAILHGQAKPARSPKTQELLFLLVTPQQCIELPHQSSDASSENSDEETEDWIL